MDTYPSKQRQHKGTSSGLRRFLFALICFSQAAIVVCVLVIGRLWITSQTPGQHPTPTPIVLLSPPSSPSPSPSPSPTHAPTPTPTATLESRIDAYIDHLTPTQQIGQLLMLPIYTNGYSAALSQPLQQWDIANAIVYNQYNGGPLMPTTLSGWTQLVHDLQAHANQALIIATDEEGGNVDRLAPYYGPTPSPQQLGATGDPQQVYAQALLDAQRLQALGINADFAPLADVAQGGAIDQSRMFGTTPRR